jgi:general secretion pathway protein J
LKRNAEILSGLKPGFTLIEVMVAMTVTGIIVLLIFGVFRLGLSAWEKGESAQKDQQKARMISQLLSRQVKSAFPYRIKTEKAEEDFLVFEGKPRGLKFVSALPLKSRYAQGLVYAVYEFEEGGDAGGRVILYEERALNKNFVDEPPRKEDGVVLWENVSEIRFEYYRGENPEKTREAAWVEEWNSREEKQLPEAVRITVTERHAPQAPRVIETSLPAHEFEPVKIGPTRSMVVPTAVRPSRLPQ